MAPRHTLLENERATQERVGRLRIDYPAAHAVSSLYRAANAVRRNLTNTVLREHDLTWTGFLVLWLLWIWGAMETRLVAEEVGISKGSLTGVMNTLIARGLIERVPSETDRRRVELRLTPEGESLMDELYPEFNAAESALVHGLSGRDLKRLTESLRTITTTAEASED
jgi:DNA-binding MarR family transcriptional regulator